MSIANLQQYTESLGYGLLVPRATVKFRDLTGVPGVRVEPVSSIETKVKPIVITTREDYDFIGAKSGQRSGLITLNDQHFKIKGCRIEKALETDGTYTDNHGGNYVDPEGGILRSDVMREIIGTIRLNAILTEEGFPTLHEPAAIIHYGKMFKSEHMPQEEELLALVMKTKGDTRLPEIYRREVKDDGAASELIYRLGVLAGAEKKVTENFGIVWSYDGDAGNAHIGNYVLFIDNNSLQLCTCDLESMVMDLDELSSVELQQAHEKETKRMLSSLLRSPLGLVDGIDIEDFDVDMHLVDQGWFISAFVTGFSEGYENPNKRQIIPLELLLESFDFDNYNFRIRV